MKSIYLLLAFVCLLPSFHTKALSVPRDDDYDAITSISETDLEVDNDRFLGMLAKLIPTAIKGISALVNKIKKKQRLDDDALMEIGFSETDIAELGDENQRIWGAIAKLIPTAIKGISALVSKIKNKQRFDDEGLLELGLSETDLAELGEEKDRIWGALISLIPTAVKGITALVNKLKKKQRFDGDSMFDLEMIENDLAEFQESNQRFLGMLAKLIPTAIKGITALVNKIKKKQRSDVESLMELGMSETDLAEMDDNDRLFGLLAKLIPMAVKGITALVNKAKKQRLDDDALMELGLSETDLAELKNDKDRFLGMLASLIPMAVKGITALVNKIKKKQRFDDDALMELGLTEMDLVELGDDKERFFGMLAKLIPTAIKGISALVNKIKNKQRFDDESLMELGMSETDLAELGDKERFFGMLAKLIPAAIKGIGALINKKKQRFDDEALSELGLSETELALLSEDNERFLGMLASLIPMAVKGITALVNKFKKKSRFDDEALSELGLSENDLALLSEDNERIFGLLASLIPMAVKGITALVNKAKKKSRFDDEALMELGLSETDVAELGEYNDRFLGALASLIPMAVKGITALVNKFKKKSRFDEESLMDLGLSDDELAELGGNERIWGAIAKLVPMAIKGIGALVNKIKNKQRIDGEFLSEVGLSESDVAEMGEYNERIWGALAKIIPKAVKVIGGVISQFKKKQ